VNKRCKGCNFWSSYGEVSKGLEYGTCQRRAPQPRYSSANPEVGSNEAWWPDTNEFDWCGDWAPFRLDADDALFLPWETEMRL